jgi:hypothetical protein
MIRERNNHCHVTSVACSLSPLAAGRPAAPYIREMSGKFGRDRLEDSHAMHAARHGALIDIDGTTTPTAASLDLGGRCTSPLLFAHHQRNATTPQKTPLLPASSSSPIDHVPFGLVLVVSSHHVLRITIALATSSLNHVIKYGGMNPADDACVWEQKVVVAVRGKKTLTESMDSSLIQQLNLDQADTSSIIFHGS